MTGRKHLVAALCRAPLVAEAVASAMEDVAEVRRFAPDAGGIDGLLDSLRPDAVLVDTTGAAASIEPAAARHDIPVVHVSLHEPRLRVLVGRTWEEPAGGDASAEAVRNAIVGALYGGRRR